MTARPFYFLIIPQRGDSVRSLLNYKDQQQAEETAKAVASLTMRSRCANARPELCAIAGVKQEYINIVVINSTTKEAVKDQRLMQEAI